MSDDVKVKVVAYESHIIIETVKPDADENFVPFGGSNIGCVLMDTKKYLGISKEAWKLMKKIKKGGGDIGDVALWKSDKKGDCFSWLGGTHKLINTSDNQIESSRDGIVDIAHITIPNNVPPAALEAIVKTSD
ncbi:hypothetical protein KAR91_67780 [Candidatus Pacearchaeota archaeon]|nr:hypothetical protein [Candidatus Pacearchaeota archaeon]